MHQHSDRGIQRAGPHRGDANKDDGVQDMGQHLDAGLPDGDDKGGGVDVVAAKEIGVGVWDQDGDDGGSDDIEDL